MIAVLGGLADVERDLIRTRTAEGRSRSQKCGQHMSRPPKLTPAQKAEAPGDGRRARRSRNSRAATAWERARFHDCDDKTLPGRFRSGAAKKRRTSEIFGRARSRRKESPTVQPCRPPCLHFATPAGIAGSLRRAFQIYASLIEPRRRARDTTHLEFRRLLAM